MLLALALLATPALAWDDDDDDDRMQGISGRCPGTILKNTRLDGDIIAQPGDPDPCIGFGKSNIRLDMNGFFINVSTAADETFTPTEVRAIATNGWSNVRVEGGGGFILTAYPNRANTGDPLNPLYCRADVLVGLSPCAIHVQGGSNVRIRDVFIRNTTAGAVWGPVDLLALEKGASPTVVTAGVPICPASSSRGGAGIGLLNTYKAKIFDNFIECFNFGVHVVESNGDGSADDLITHNIIKDNSHEFFSSSGIFFQNASGWLVARNVLTGNGTDPMTTTDSNIVLTAGSTRNRIEQNKTDNNRGPGLFIDAGAIKNTVSRNHVTWNSGGLPNATPEAFAGGWDVGDANLTPANFYKRNTCRFQAGPGVPPGQCDPTIN